MNVVVDTNIVFSALLNSSSRIGRMLVMSPIGCFNFYSCRCLRSEITKHFDKLKKHTKLSDVELAELIPKVEQRITFIDELLLSKDVLEKAGDLVDGIDPADAPFIAVAESLNTFLWTGDRVLISGLRAKNYRNFRTTEEMAELLEIYKKTTHTE